MASKNQYWLFKSEPDEFSIDDLKKVKLEPWSGVRNYQVRNFMRDEMKIGDLVLFYHSSCAEPGVVGVAKVVSESYPDPTQFKKGSKYFDEKSPKDNPRWLVVDVEFVERFSRIITLAELREESSLSELLILRKGNRLSITPVNPSEFKKICALA
jgi:predicted RNA-binding protein with PUA-like domain